MLIDRGAEMGSSDLAVSGRKKFNLMLIILSFVLLAGILLVYFFPLLYMVIPVPVYLTFHTILEFSSVVVSIAVFIVAWYNFRQTHSKRELIICLTFLAVGIIDFAHALSYQGMPEFFTPNSANKASTYWVFGRLIQAVGLLTAVLVKPGKPKKIVNPVSYLLFTIVSVVGVLVFVAVDVRQLPEMYREGLGQTSIKIISEYIVILIHAITFIYLFSRKKMKAAERHIEAALLLGIFSEIAFILYSSAYDTYNLIGHIYKIAAFISILRGLFIDSVVRLYQANRILQDKRRKLAELNTQLKKVNQLKTDFLANTNHELRTPLTAIIAFTELLLDEDTGPLNDIQKDYLQEVNDSSQKLLVEINNLLDLTKLEAGQMKVYRQLTPFHEVVSEVLRQLNPIFKQKQQQVTVKFADRLPNIPIDREKVKKVMVNLLSNAHKFSPAGESISVDAALSENRNYVIVNVKDYGIGFAEEQVAHIFDKFYQIEGSLIPQQYGTGLGLTLVKYLVELHGGSVWVSSKPGSGSTFSFKIPVNLPDQEVV